MTDIQDLICDRLVAATIGPHWVGGPLHAAALVLDPAFVPATRGDARPRQFARAVGWPVVFCEAVTGANAVLPEPDRRSLAITLFAKVPPVNPGGKPKPMPGAVSQAAAGWAVGHGHATVCTPACPLATTAGIAAYGPYTASIDCVSAPGLANVRVTSQSTAAHHAVVAFRYYVQLVTNPDDSHSCADAIREAAKAETKAGGVDGAADFCLTLAGKLGLTG